ncbi:MAG: zf-HC2 domain-containing protein [Gemmatimonadaceae bacterium]|nr:zf-HC2 domain-containing protein [Gemmatimonadaceae bacterium]
MSTPMSCAEVQALEARYLAGTLAVHEARAVEAHAARCAGCEARLASVTHRSIDFAPPLPVALRDEVLAAVATRARAPRVVPGAWRAWDDARGERPAWVPRAAIGVAAAAMLAIVVVRSRGDDVRTAASTARGATDDTTMTTRASAATTTTATTTASTTTNAAPVTASAAVATSASALPGQAMLQAAEQLADARAASEFAALDQAAREVEAALVTVRDADDARGLAAQLARLRLQRAALAGRVREAAT